MDTSIEVGDIFRLFGPVYVKKYGQHMPLCHHRSIRALSICRTKALGGHVAQCDQCGAIKICYNSCRNRHCPKCQSLAQWKWVEERQKDLLPIPYFHVVFTLPEALRPLALQNQRVIYNLLFQAASQTLLTLSADPKYLGAQIGVTSVLHTWSQTLMNHPHLHCLVTGGGLSEDGIEWRATRKDFFLPVQVMASLFRGKFLAFLKKAYEQDRLIFCGQIAQLADENQFKHLIDGLYQKGWIVYCKPPFAGPKQVLDYLGRYTHRIAIGNEHILHLVNDQVTFSYRDRAQDKKKKRMTLSAFEFIRRFLLHILPDSFVKIRHYGLSSNRHRNTTLRWAQSLLGICLQEIETPKPTWQDLMVRITGIDPCQCQVCGRGRLVLKEVLFPQKYRAPPHP
jgi:hypothetical protein